MVSSFTTNKSLEKPANGDYVDTWNVPVNGDMDVIDQALGGTTFLNATGGSATLSVSQYRAMALSISGAMSGNVTYTIPSGVGGVWIVYNNTTDASGGPWSVTIRNAAGGTTVVVRRGFNTTIYSDGTNIRLADNSASPGGSNTQVQFNQSGFFAGSPNFVYDFTNVRVGIGISAPNRKLEVSSDDAVTDVLVSRNSSGLGTVVRWDHANTWSFLYNNTSAPFLFGTNNTERMRLDAAGNLAVGVDTAFFPDANRKSITINGTNTSLLTLSNGGVSTNSAYLFWDGNNLSTSVNKTNGVMNWSTNGGERMRLDASGNLGIGTTVPTAKLSVNGTINQISQGTSTGQIFAMNNGGNFYHAIDSSAGANFGSPYSAVLWHSGSYPMLFATSNAEKMRLDATGNLGIGTQNPNKKLVVSDSGAVGIELSPNDAAQGYNRIFNYNRSNSQYVPVRYEASTHTWFAGAAGTTRAADIDTSGNLGIGISNPSYRLDVATTNPTRGIVAQVSNLSASSPTGAQLTFLQNSVNYWTIGQPAGVDAFSVWRGRYVGGDGTEVLRINSSGNLFSYGQINAITSTGGVLNLNSTTTGTGNVIGSYQNNGASYAALTLSALTTAMLNNGSETARFTADNLVGIQNNDPPQLLGIGSSTAGTGLGFGSTTSNYSNIFSAYSSASLVMGTGVQGGRSSDIYTSSYGGGAIYRNAIRLDIGANGIQFLANPLQGVSRGSAVTMIERMRITPDGLVGINVTNPSARLQVNGTIYSTSGGYIFPDGSTQTTAAFNLGYTPVNKAGDTMTGYLQINVASTGILRLNSSNFVNAIYFMNGNSVNGQLGANNAYPFYVQNASSQDTLYCDQSGNFYAVGNITAYSDRSLKENIEQIGDALSKVSKMVGVSYNRKLTGKKEIGLVAQDVRDVVPEVVSEGADGTLGVAYGNLVAMCVEAIKELKGRVEALEAR